MIARGIANGRVQRVLAHLATKPTGATARELIIQTEPGCKLVNMASSLTAMISAGYIERTGTWGRSLYRLAPPAAVPVEAEPEPAPVPAPRATRRAKPADAPARTPSASKRAAAAPAPSPAPTPASSHSRGAIPFNEPRVPMTMPNRPRRDCPLTADEIAAHVAAFVAKGGQIEQLPRGASSQPLTTNPLHAANEAAWRERELLLANLQTA
jgi:hypothetical protein